MRNGVAMKVVIADDDVLSQIMLQGAVEQLGHDCVTASDGAEAWERITSAQPDVLITDLMMPGINGFELCRRVRNLDSDRYIYIIIATSLGAQGDVRDGIEVGADDFLTKPIDPFDLETRLVAAQRIIALHTELAEYRRQLARLASIDPMTQLLNRQTLDKQLAALHAHSTRHHRPYALAMCDIDHFKSYNDTYGHQAGDDTLRRIATTIDTGRDNDLVYRYGGEEFLILLPEQDIHGALLAAERIRANVQALGSTHHQEAIGGALTVSIGVAEFDPDHPTPANQVLKAADDALYQAKSRGRNQVTAHERNVARTTVPV